jgi:hypothetical protein
VAAMPGVARNGDKTQDPDQGHDQHRVDG